MDEYLSNIYGTGASPESLEKTAQAELLYKLAEEEGIDLSGLNEEQLGALADQVVANNAAADPNAGGVVEPAAAAPAEAAAEEEAQAKFAEADFLGRVMAHSYTQELNKIAMEGGPPPFAAKKKCEKCGKEDCTCPAAEKTAGGPLGRAIQSLGGTVGEPAAQEVPEAVKLAFSTLKQHGYLE